MLPITLTVRNFLSYRDAAPPLRLADIHVACLCGPNGHGKSALLDAITWALWGQARGRSHEQLLHHGQDEMAVELEFEVSGERYRVTRRFSRARRSAQSSLELAVAAGDSFRPITGDSIPQTQAQITRLINMDYDTFVNSAFLVQGRADLFTMATPAHRKEVLSRVLGLGIYERLEARAKDRARAARARLQASELIMDRLREQVARKDEVRHALETVEAELAASQAAADSLRERQELVQRQLVQLERRQTELGQLEDQLARAATRRRDAAEEARRLEERLKQWRQAMLQSEETEKGWAELVEARRRWESLNATAQAVHALERELFPLEKAIAAARAALEKDIQSQRRHIEQELRPRAAALPAVESRQRELQEAASSLEAAASEIAELVVRQQALVMEATRLEQENAALSQQGKENATKLELLSHNHEAAACPLCGSRMDESTAARIRADYEREVQRQRAQYRENAAAAKRARAEAEELGRQAEQRKQRLDAERSKVEAEQGRLAVQAEEAQRAQAQLEIALRVLAEAEDALAKQSYAASEQAAAGDLRERIAAMQFDPTALQDADRRVRDLARWEAAYQALSEARTRLPEDEAALQRVGDRMREAEEEVRQLEALREEVRREVRELPEFQARARTLAAELEAANRAREDAQARKASLAHQLEQIEAAEEELRQRERERRGMVEEAAAYDELATAFGKGGVQALLIEAAIPRLEDEANELLMRMTDGRMSLKLETQRTRRTGRAAADPIETLEIVIADELGTRSYEMFSGGERFRIDFALRIALSKVLAWRAGAPLPTLFIDEGFGTQDAEGRDRILDVIKAIEDRFQRILVITHMDEIKEAFPVRIEVTRTPGAGSTFSIV